MSETKEDNQKQTDDQTRCFEKMLEIRKKTKENPFRRKVRLAFIELFPSDF